MKKMTYIVLVFCLFISMTACGKKQDNNTGSIVVEETLATEDKPVDNDTSEQYILDEKERLNENRPVTNESSNYAEIEQLMNQIAERTAGKKGT